VVALFVTIDILALGQMKLNINEYLTLLKFQHDAEQKSFPFEPDYRYFPRLLEDGFLKKNEDNTYSLGEAGLRVFKGNDMFEEFYGIFPHKVETGLGFRPVSTTDVNSISAKVTRGIWERVIKNKPYLQQKIIDGLKRELAHRKADGSMAYLHNIDTWLRQATWEKWDDIPDKKTNNSYTKL
jgi:hypothetical protein